MYLRNCKFQVSTHRMTNIRNLNRTTLRVHSLHSLFESLFGEAYDDFFRIRGAPSSSCTTRMSMVLSNWIITPKELGWIRPINRL